MAIIFGWRGNQKDARYSLKTGSATEYKDANRYPTITADAVAIGGYSLDLTGSFVDRRFLLFAGNNLSFTTGGAFSILVRFKPAFSGTPATYNVLCGFSGRFTSGPGYGAFWLNGSGQLGSIFRWSANGNQTFAVTSSAQVLDATTTDYFDIVMTCNGTSTGGFVNYFIDGTTVTASSVVNQIDGLAATPAAIALGGAPENIAGAYAPDGYIEEFVIWNTVIDPTNVTLTSGLGSLNGSSRTAFVDVDAVDPANSTDPGVANVKSGVEYIIQGTTYTGTATIPSAPSADTRVVFGYLYDVGGNAIENAEVRFQISATDKEYNEANGTSDNFVVGGMVKATTNASGYFSTSLLKTTAFEGTVVYKVEVRKKGAGIYIDKDGNGAALTFSVANTTVALDITSVLTAI